MISAFETYFESLRGRRIVVLGLGVSNRPLVRLLLEFGCDVTGCDRTPRERLEEEVLELERMGCKLSVGDTYLGDLSADLVFRTPGMHPGNPAIVALKEKGAEGVREVIEEITKELKYTMTQTATPDLAHFDKSVVRNSIHHW